MGLTTTAVFCIALYRHVYYDCKHKVYAYCWTLATVILQFGSCHYSYVDSLTRKQFICNCHLYVVANWVCPQLYYHKTITKTATISWMS